MKLPALSGLQTDGNLKGKTGISAHKKRISQLFLLYPPWTFLASVGPDKFIAVPFKGRNRHIRCKINQRCLFRLRLSLYTILIDQNLFFLHPGNGKLMFIVALPLELSHEFHHSELHKRINHNFPVLIRLQRQLPDQRIFLRPDIIQRLRAYPVFFGLKPRISHAVRGLPGIRTFPYRHIGRTPYGISVFDIGIKAAPVRRQMEETVMIDSPDLRGSVKRHSSPCMGHHHMKGPVRQIIHPRRRHIVP